MIETEEVRLVKVTEDNPKGKIVGWLKIERGSIYYKHEYEIDWVRAYFLEGIPRFNHLEHLAPFKDKDGGELYAGDIISQDICKGVLIFGMGSNDLEGWWMQDEDILEVNHVRPVENSPITKLGNIYEEG